MHVPNPTLNQGLCEANYSYDGSRLLLCPSRQFFAVNDFLSNKKLINLLLFPCLPFFPVLAGKEDELLVTSAACPFGNCHLVIAAN